MNQLQSAFSRIATSAILISQIALLSTNVHAAENSTAQQATSKPITNNIFAVNSRLSQIVPHYHPQTYCTADIEAQTNHPRHVNILRRDIDCMLTALKPYQQLDTSNDADTDPNVPYFAYKAQAWLNYAYSKNIENSLTDAGAYALSEGLTILQLLQENRTDELILTTDVPPTSAIMRADLWATLMALKHNGATVDSPRELAFGEVQLIWAAAEYCDSGWRRSNEHFSAAQKWIEASYDSFINHNTESKALQLQDDASSLFQMFEQLDTGDDQCQEYKITSFSTEDRQLISYLKIMVYHILSGRLSGK